MTGIESKSVTGLQRRGYDGKYSTGYGVNIPLTADR
jgi:hypothetical protein